MKRVIEVMLALVGITMLLIGYFTKNGTAIFIGAICAGACPVVVRIIK